MQAEVREFDDETSIHHAVGRAHSAVDSSDLAPVMEEMQALCLYVWILQFELSLSQKKSNWNFLLIYRILRQTTTFVH